MTQPVAHLIGRADRGHGFREIASAFQTSCGRIAGMGEVTPPIERGREGDPGAFDRIFELLCPELRQIARRRLARGAGDGLIETTALVNRCYLDLIQRKAVTPTDRSLFLAYSADGVMRSILVDAACGVRTDRRGGNTEQVTLYSEPPHAARCVLRDPRRARSDGGSRPHRCTAGANGRDAVLRRHRRCRDYCRNGPVDADRVWQLGRGAAAAGPRTANLTAPNAPRMTV